ncbi:hypothetical protein [Rhizobium leguminosarum]|uniref:hypothetical protein n=1 Tax=Rhizobium leguminosarum TaxID=384 RepID=UPI001C93A09B|nr:hypothetical protein [Rhizobium leguminosarum]MBY5821459.1 hypothetical protein [Rhizobium leguminosarum]
MSEIPEDIFQTACGIVMEAKSLKSMLRHTDVVDAIAVALLAERERAASVASHFMGSLWSSDQNHVASLIFNEISHPSKAVSNG